MSLVQAEGSCVKEGEDLVLLLLLLNKFNYKIY